MPSIQKSLQLRPVKTKHLLAPRQQDSQVGNHETRPVSLQYWKAIMDLSLVGCKA